MAAKKLDFAVRYGTISEPVKARIFQAVDGSHWANISGDLFNDVEISADRIDQIMAILGEVRECIRKASDAGTT